MAEAAVDSLDCLLCSEELVEPLTLSCEHRFCERCLREHWAPSRTGPCPKCKRRWSKEFPPGFSLDRGTEQSPERPTDEPVVSQRAPSGGEHSEQHQFNVDKLKEKKKRTEERVKQYKSMSEHTVKQAQSCEEHITAHFKQLHQFLLQDEESRLSALRKEREEKTQIIEEELKQLEDQLSSLRHSIDWTEQQLQGHSLDSSLRELMESVVLTEEPKLRSGILIDQASVLGNLDYNVWKKMETIVNYRSVILDPNTALGELSVSEDLTSVRHRETPQDVPLNKERFMNYPSVLGSEEFTSWFHRWEVEVGDHPDWSIRVVRESAERKDMCETLPKDGLWCLTYRDNKYTDVKGEMLNLWRRPQKICVNLFCDTWSGRISFYYSSDMALIWTYSDSFTERLRLYFSVGKAGDDIVTKDIKMCQISAPAQTVESGEKHFLSELDLRDKYTLKHSS